MIKVEHKKDCTGCAACANICPIGCISMIEDNEGFVYPQVNDSECIKCGMCDKACPIKKCKPTNTEVKNTLAYAVVNKDDRVRYNSSSGAVFPLLANYVLEKNGVVFGAAFDDNYSVCHCGIDNKNEVERLYTSKYVQSNIGDCYKQAKKNLDEDKWVLFSGTPCQIAGLNAFLNGKMYEKLITIDFICHGVPSAGIWRKYVNEYIGKPNNISNINFRCKKHGWSNYHFLAEYKDGKKSIYESAQKNSYVNGFLKNLYLRPSCYDCSFKSLNRISDITIADFWGVRHICPKLYDDKGCSLVVVNTKKGEAVFDCLKPGMIYEEANINEAVKHNSAMVKSVVPHIKRQEFFERCNDENICTLIDELCKESMKVRIKRYLNRICRRLRRVIER